MSENLKKQFPKLQIIASIQSLKGRKLLLKEFSSDPDFCKAVREIVRNTLQKNVKIHEADKKRLLKYREVLISLGKKQKSTKKEQQLVQQTGTGIFLPIVIPLVAQLIGHLLKQ